MSVSSRRTRRRVASAVVVLSAFAALAPAPPAFASDRRDEAVPGSPSAVAQPIVQEFLVLQPQMSAILIGLTMAQLATLTPSPHSAATAQSPVQAPPGPSIVRPTARPRGLVPLYASYAVLQALDAHSTLRAINGGAFEQNPVMAPIVNRPAALVAFKAATTAGAILAAQRLAKHNRVAAYALMVGLNSAYAFVVVHNYKVAAR